MAAAIVVGQAWLTSVVVAGVFLGGGSLATVAAPLVAIAVLALVRAGFLLAADGLAQARVGPDQGHTAGRPDCAAASRSDRPGPVGSGAAS